MKRGDVGYGWMWASVLLALLLALVPLPASLDALRPYWLALLVAYWVLESPERVADGMGGYRVEWRALGILYDEDEAGRFFQLYSRPLFGAPLNPPRTALTAAWVAPARASPSAATA